MRPVFATIGLGTSIEKAKFGLRLDVLTRHRAEDLDEPGDMDACMKIKTAGGEHNRHLTGKRKDHGDIGAERWEGAGTNVERRCQSERNI
jgi:hypothetical protein